MLPTGEFSHFIRNVSNIPLLTAKQEVQLATQLHAAKTGYWQLLLSNKATQKWCYHFLQAQLELMLTSKVRTVVPRRVLLRVKALVTLKSLPQAAGAVQKLDWGNTWWAKCYKKLLRTKPTPKALLRQIRAKQAEARVAKEKLFFGNVRLAIKQASTCSMGTDHLSMFDLIQEGYTSLWHTIDRFDPARKCRLATYIIWWINHDIHRAQANKGKTIRLPVHAIEMHQKVYKAIAMARLQTGVTPTTDDLSKQIKLSKVNVLLAQQLPVPFQLDETEPSEEGTNFNRVYLGTIPNGGASPEDAAIANNTKAYVQKLMVGLTERERYVITHRFGLHNKDEGTLSDIGNAIGISRERVRQLEQIALSKMNFQGMGLNIGINRKRTRNIKKVSV